MGDRQARDECALQLSVECASGQEEAYAASCGDLLSCGHEGGEGLGNITPRVACLSLTELLCPKPKWVAERRFHPSSNSFNGVKKNMCKPSVS